MLQLNPLSSHVTFTTIVRGAYPGRPKCAKQANQPYCQYYLFTIQQLFIDSWTVNKFDYLIYWWVFCLPLSRCALILLETSALYKLFTYLLTLTCLLTVPVSTIVRCRRFTVVNGVSINWFVGNSATCSSCMKNKRGTWYTMYLFFVTNIFFSQYFIFFRQHFANSTHFRFL